MALQYRNPHGTTTHKDIARRHRNEVFSLIPVATETVLEYWPLETR